MLKKLLSMSLCTILAVSALSGCGTDTPGSSQAESGEKPAANVSDVETSSTSDGKFDDVRLKMLVCWNGGFPTASDQYNNDVAEKIREETGVTVEYEGIMMSETEKLNLMFASGDMPDIINAPYWGGTKGETAVIKKAGAEGRLIDIKDMLANYENLKAAYEIGTIGSKYYENDINYPDFNGATYILPQEVGAGVENETNWAYGVFVRGDVPEALGIDEKQIKTTEQLYDFLVKARDYGFKDVNGNDCIVATTYHEGWDNSGYYQNFKPHTLTGDNGYFLNEDKKVDYLPLTENFVDKHLFLWKLVNENILDKESFKHSDAQADEKVGNGTALFASAQYGTVIKSTQLTGLYNSNPEMRYTWVGPLSFEGGEAATQLRSEGRNGSPAIVFPTTCSNIDAALTYLNYVNSEEGAKLCQYGIEGVTYELNDQNQPRMNAEWTAKFAEDNEKTKEELREFGVGYMLGRVLCADKRMSWWGEKDAFQAEAENEFVKEYKEVKPVEQIDGYSIDGIVPNFERYTEVSEIAWEGTTEKDYTERAYFAETEEEARKILEDYQEYLRTGNGGALPELLDWMTEQLGTRDDFVF
ncbi:extracellular solute-binding protein [Scatolibacter rhodanostii]|uniref:extracellular solute-binding protein n=1 Tax=Scatolibacter rhodanostii TaxID=2014781 RepID=UPI000C080EDF|nr:extracellular solute-binding protein [Scatolibacter rhodanostii]